MENKELYSCEEIKKLAISRMNFTKKLINEESIAIKSGEKDILFYESVIQLCKDWEGVFNG